MALPININELMAGSIVESERIEFKKGWNPESVIHAISAFANDINNLGGGYIILGVEEKDGKPILPPSGISLNEIEKIQKELLNLCHLIKPNYFPVAEPIDFLGKKIFIIWVPGGQNIPYQAPISLSGKLGYAYYIRRFSSTVKAKNEEIKEFISYAGKIPFDDRIHHNSDIHDLKLVLIQEFLKEIGSELFETSSKINFVDLCKQMRIVDGPKEYLKPVNAGLLFFNDNPQKFIPYSQIEIVEFKTDESGDKLSEKIFKGPIQSQLREALSYLKNSVLKEYVEKVPDKAEAIRYFNYPFIAIEEALANSLYHRDYEIREPVEVRISQDKIEILSYPGPDRSITQEDIKEYRFVSRRYRNRRIGEFFKELKITEGRCTGIPKILNAMKQNKSPKPIFRTNEDRTFFIVELPINKKALIEETPQKTPQKTTELEEKILKIIIADSSITRELIAEKLRISPETVKEYLEKLKSKNLIKREGGRKQGVWVVTTHEKGQQ